MDDAKSTPVAAPAGPGFNTTVGALALGQILSWGVLFYGFSSLVLPMQASLGWGKPTLMGAYTLGLAVWGISSYGVGLAIDAGRGRWVMTGGVALAALGCLGWAAVQQPWQLYVVWALLGAAMALCLYEPAFALLTKRYPVRFRDGITVLTLVGGFASTLSFPALAGLLHAGLDWRQCLQVCAAVLGLVVPLYAWALAGPAHGTGSAAAGTGPEATLGQALQGAAFWLLTLCFMLVSFVQAAWWAHVMPALDALGVAPADALWLVMAVGPAQSAGRLVFVTLGRGWPLRRLGLVVLALGPLALGVLVMDRHWPALLLFALLFGAANGLLTIVRGAVVPLYWGRGQVGRIGGLMSGIGLVSRAAAPLAAAWLLWLVPGYREVMLLLAGLGALAWLAFWRAGPPPPAVAHSGQTRAVALEGAAQNRP